MCGWFMTETALPMSWHSEATTTSSEAPASSARVAVCREWTSWSTSKPSVISSSEASMAQHPLGHAGLVLDRLDDDVLPLLGGGLVHPGERHGAIIAPCGLRRPAGRGRRQPRRHGPRPPDRPAAVRGRAARKPSVAPTARRSSRSSGGGGKYSSSVVTVTSVTPSAGARRAITASTNASGAEAPAVTPTVPVRSSGARRPR